jgi:hypothetical protein
MEPHDDTRARRDPRPRHRACIIADEAFAELGIDRTTGYRAIKEGTFPCPSSRRPTHPSSSPRSADSSTPTTTTREPDGRRPVR